MALYIKGTKSEHEREQKEVERLVKKSPPKKPPRIDKERRTIKIKDPDLDQKDPDLSLNYKDIGGSVAQRFIVALDLEDDDPGSEIPTGGDDGDDNFDFESGEEDAEGERGEEDEDPIDEEIEPPTRPPSEAKIVQEAERLYHYDTDKIQGMLRDDDVTDAEKSALYHALRLKTKPFPPGWEMAGVFHEGLLTLKARHQLREHMKDWDARSFAQNINYIKERQLNDSLVTGRDDTRRYYDMVLEVMMGAQNDFEGQDYPPLKTLADAAEKLNNGDDLAENVRRTGIKSLLKLLNAAKDALSGDGAQDKEGLRKLITLLRGSIMTRKLQSKTAQYRGVVQQGVHPDYRVYRKTDALNLGVDDYVKILKSAKAYVQSPFIGNDLARYNPDMAYRIALDYAIFTEDNGVYDKKVDAPTYDALLSILTGHDC